MHVQTFCNQINCSTLIFTNRHPKPCKYFSLTGICKFSQDCAFRHVKNCINMKVEQAEKEIGELKSEIKFLKSNIIQSENELFKEVIVDLEKTIAYNTKRIEALHDKTRLLFDGAPSKWYRSRIKFLNFLLFPFNFLLLFLTF